MINTIYYFFIFVAGTLFGSFLNLVSDRVVKGKNFMVGRSECDHCKHPLKPTNLIPVLSYLFQRGRCSFCKEKLSWYYPFSEFLTGLAFVFSAYYSHVLTDISVMRFLDFAYLTIVICFYIVLVLADMKYRLVPSKVVYPAIFFVFIFILGISILQLAMYRNLLQSDPFGMYLIKAGFWNRQVVAALIQLLYTLGSAFGISLFFLFLIYITKGRGMGGGDLNLGFLIGLFNGFPFNLLAIFLGFVFGAVYSLGLIAIKRKTVKDTIPFGPFLLLGSIVAMVFGKSIVNWYLGLF